MKRFPVTGVTRDKAYDLTNGKAQSKVFYFSANPNGEAEIVTVLLRQSGSIKKLKWDLDFADLDIKSRGVRGNTVTKYTVKRIELKEEGVSTLKPRDIWFDETVGRLNVDGRGDLVGAFRGDDRLLIATQSGLIKTSIPDLNMHFPENMLILEKWEPTKPISAIYFDGVKERYFGKRFLIESADREESFIKEGKQNILELISTGETSSLVIVLLPLDILRHACPNLLWKLFIVLKSHNGNCRMMDGKKSRFISR